MKNRRNLLDMPLVDANRPVYMTTDAILFHHSRVRQVEAFKAVESDDSMPLDIYPAFIGSRIISYGLDATGMQGLDARQAEYPLFQSLYSDANNYDDLYLFHIAVKSSHAIAHGNDFVRMPLGWMDYSLTIDGKTFHAAQIAREAKNWRRTFNLKTVTCTTEFDLAGIWVTIESHCTRESVIPRFEFGFVALDARKHDVTLETRWNFSQRNGSPIFEALPKAWVKGKITGLSLIAESNEQFKVLENYPLTFAVCGGKPFQSQNLIGVRRELRLNGKAAANCSIAYYVGSHQSGTNGDSRAIKSLSSLDPYSKHVALMEKYWQGRAQIASGEVRTDWLYHYNLYIADFGTTMEFGAQCSGNFVPFHLGDRVFWDSHHIIDGILHAGATDHARKKIDWLEKAIAANEGDRPFYWMVHYNGKTEAADSGFMSICAHAMSAQRIAQFAQDAALSRRCFAIVDVCVRYAIKEKFFEKTPQGWILSTAASTDVTFSEEFLEKAKNNTYTFCWFLSVLEKGLEMAKKAGKQNAPHWKTAAQITSGYYLEQNEREYLDQRDGKTGERTDSYIPILCYPSEGHRWVDRDKYQHTRSLHDHYCTNIAFSGFKMPWPMQWGASSDFRVDLADAGATRLRDARNYYVGLGLPSESLSEGFVGTTQPYISASGTLLTAQSEQFFYTDFFTGDIKLFAFLGRDQELRPCSFERIHGSYGLRANGRYSLTSVEAEIHSPAARTQAIEITVPYLLRHLPVELRVNGKVIAHGALSEKYFSFVDAEDKWRTFAYSGKTISVRALPLKKGVNRITLHAAPEEKFTPSQTLVYDSHFFGQALGKLPGIDGKWHRVNSRRTFLDLLPQADTAIVTDSTWNPGGSELDTLEQFVHGGGKLILFFEAALKSYPISRLTGLSLDHACGHRWTQKSIPTTIIRTGDAPRHLPARVEFLDEPRFKGEVKEGVKILYKTADDAVYCTIHQLGDGAVLWVSSGQPYLTKREFLNGEPWQKWFLEIYKSFLKNEL
nr:hypothetical protein [Oscillatoria laete-virens]